MATLKDVAKEAGLSVGTVSRVLNNRGYISEETRESVHRAMKRLNYQPNEMARSLSRQRSSMIGVIVPNIAHPYFSMLISCLENAFHREGYEMLLFASHGKADQEEEYVRACVSNRVAGLILCTGSVKTARLRNLGFPVVTFERFLNDADAGVECDNYGGGVLAAQELISAGCRNVASIGGGGVVSMPADGRQEGFLEECGRHADVRVHSFSCSVERILDMEYLPEICRFLEQVPDVDGVFANSDVIALQVISALQKKGRKVPKDVRVIGYDDVLPLNIINPALTTIHQPVAEMAEACMMIIKKASQGESFPVRTIFHVTLVRRETT